MVKINKIIVVAVITCLMIGLTGCDRSNDPSYAYNHSEEIQENIMQVLVDAINTDNPDEIYEMFSTDIQNSDENLLEDAKALIDYIEGDDITFYTLGAHSNYRGHESQGYSCEIDGDYELITSKKSYTVLFTVYPTVLEGYEGMKGLQVLCVDESKPEGRECLATIKDKGITFINEDNLEEYTQYRIESRYKNNIFTEDYTDVVQAVVDGINNKDPEMITKVFSKETQEKYSNLSDDAMALIEYVQGTDAVFEKDETRKAKNTRLGFTYVKEILGSYKIITSEKEYHLVFSSFARTDEGYEDIKGVQTICLQEYNPEGKELVTIVAEPGIVVITDENYDDYVEYNEWDVNNPVIQEKVRNIYL